MAIIKFCLIYFKYVYIISSHINLGIWLQYALLKYKLIMA